MGGADRVQRWRDGDGESGMWIGTGKDRQTQEVKRGLGPRLSSVLGGVLVWDALEWLCGMFSGVGSDD